MRILQYLSDGQAVLVGEPKSPPMIFAQIFRALSETADDHAVDQIGDDPRVAALTEPADIVAADLRLSLQPGHSVEIHVPGIGTLINPVSGAGEIVASGA